MGYMLSSLGQLPVDDEVQFYIFVINDKWEEPLYSMIERNFSTVAQSIGNQAVIAKGFHPEEWHEQVAEAYLGQHYEEYRSLLPAILVTDAHPSKVHEKSMRLLVPLRDVEERFGGWPRFFTALADFVQFRSDEFLKRFHAKEDGFDQVNKIVTVQPGAFGISINVNEIISWWRRRTAAGHTQ